MTAYYYVYYVANNYVLMKIAINANIGLYRQSIKQIRP